jgi:coenzyme F420-reducing hydrogenase beta subunit
MCGDLCPKDAIAFESGNDGFWFPVVDLGKCVNCGLCTACCPVLNETVNKNAKTPDVYVAWIENEDIRLKSTSGGLYYALGETMLNDGGYVAGCVFSSDYKSAFHDVGNTFNDLDRIFRSKYFQSDTANVYKKVKTLLDRGEKVLFSGTPCQNAALMEFLNTNYDNLVQCDFICRGINSPKAHVAHVKELEKKYGAEVEFFNFKNKTRGWTMLGLLVKFRNGKVSFTHRYDSPWTRGYIGSNLYMRRSCEHCRFKKIPRVSDISFGDFWGLKSTEENMKKGMSVVMVNTEKGADFYRRALPLLYSAPQSLEKALSGNACILSCPVFDHEKRDAFFRRIENEDFSKVVFDLENTGLCKIYLSMFYTQLKERVKRWLRRLLKTN